MSVRILTGDCREMLAGLADQSVNCCVTSPPYFGLRDYGCDGQMGLEATPDEFVAGMVEVFREVRRVLRDDGTLWLNIGDSYAGSGKGGNPEGSEWKGFVGNKEREKAAKPSGKQLWGHKPKDLIGIPWMLAFALRADGWYLRQDIIWSKPNPMPESVRDRCTKAHEYLFLLSKGPRYFYDAEAIREPWTCDRDDMREKGMRTGLAYMQEGGGVPHNSIPRAPSHRGSTFTNGKTAATKPTVGHGEREDNPEGRNKRSVWTVATQPFSEAHFATFPPDLIEPCILAGCPVGGTVLDPFGGAGTTSLVADRLQRNAVLIELNPEYAAMARRRIDGDRGGLLDAMEAA